MSNTLCETTILGDAGTAVPCTRRLYQSSPAAAMIRRLTTLQGRSGLDPAQEQQGTRACRQWSGSLESAACCGRACRLIDTNHPGVVVSTDTIPGQIERLLVASRAPL